MTSMETLSWPSDADGLARIASDPGQTQERRDQALKNLLPTVQRVAQRLAARFHGPCRQDMLDEAATEVWKALERYCSEQPFEPWCYRVLRNHMIDQIRKEQREQDHLSRFAVQAAAPGLQIALEKAIDLPGTLPAGDLEAVRDWPLPQRLLVLSLSGLWQKVPTVEWSGWVAEYREARDSNMPMPFPPEELEACDTIVGRNAILAQTMNMRRNTLSAWLFRYKGRLRNLRYVRDLLDNH